MIKKVISFTILLVIFLLGFQFLISFLKTNHNIIYDLEIEGEIYSIDETYKKISGRDYYLFNVSIGDSNFLFKSDNYFNKQKKVVDSIKKYSNDNVTCISLIYKNNYASAPLCIKDNNLYSYQSFVNNENFDQFLDEIPNFSSKILEDSNTTHDFYDLEIYDDYIYDDETLLIYNYKNILRVNSEIEDILTFSSYDNYKNELGMLVGKYYLVPKFTSDSDFTLYYAFNVENEVIKDIELSKPISKQSYLNGIYDDKLYLFDKSNLIQYYIDPTSGESVEIGNVNKKGINYQNGNSSEISVYDLKNNNIKFSESLSKYETIDCELMFTFDEYAIYYNDGVFYKVYEDYLDKPIYLLKKDNIKEIIVKEDRIYFIDNEFLYRYDDYGLVTLIKRDEFNYNFENIYNVYIQ